jgi:hypothetical protein
VTDTPGELPERTRFVDPPPPAPEPAPVEDARPAVEEQPAEAPAPVVPPVIEPVGLPPVTEPAPVAAPVVAAPVAAQAPRAPRVLVALLAVLVAVTAALTAWAWPLTSAGTTTFESDGQAALKAAKADAKLVLAYDYRHLEDGFRKALKVTTDADGKDCPHKVDPADKAYDPRANCFRSEYTRTHEKVVVDLATRYRTVVLADVGAGGVERVHGDQVTVLLYVNQQSTSTQSATPKITQSRVEMIMNRVHGHWLVAGINAL